MSLLDKIEELREGYSEVFYRNKKYGLNKTVFNGGSSYKIYAEELAGNDFISLNFYITSKDHLLKPCEMPKEKVIDFLMNCSPVKG
ncbi:peptide methionine sulfoxide reductase [Leptobacterium flavescens]|uniref:Peptide methionine sulfoxide reductase n=1 Tax=Leptobacterium flavescens TaxID=472055 RepID=A0A6P0UP97_9FLAO|nr:peptide methionine sulfoxide reductase [Leptobacterium flavescens]NER13659.1 peptide methionine sulfoxide reductase [Leptobacterium flavescens]